MTPPRALSVRGMTPDEAAAAWIVRVEDGPMSAADRAAFEAWKAQSPANVAAFARAEAAWRLFDDAGDDPLLDAVRASALAAGPRRPWGLRLGIGVGLAAALVLAIGLSAGWLPFGMWGETPQVAVGPGGITITDVPENGEFATARGERRALRLADGTAVTLNTDSAVRVDYVAGRRFVHMLRGQALFEVAKDVHRPFVVQAGAKQVTALGTIFEVRLFDADRMKVTLVEGKVVVDEVELRPDESQPVMVPVVLAPGDALELKERAKPRRQKVDVDQQLRWREGFVEFSDATLSEAAAEMNRYSRRQIIINDSAVGHLRISGIFRADSPDRFAAIVGELLPISARPLPGGDIELIAAAR